MDRVVLERRMKMLNTYMQEICRRTVMDSHIGLKPLLLTFVEQGEYDRATGGGHISHTVGYSCYIGKRVLNLFF